MASFTWFLASPSEQLEALPGWRLPPAPTRPRRSHRVTNPFTGKEELQWDYGQEPLGNEPIDDADYPQLHGLPQQGGKLSPTELRRLLFP